MLIMNEKENKVRAFLKAMPKTELHVHIEATLRPETLYQIVSKHHSDPNVKSVEDIRKLFNFKNLSEFVGVFIYIQKCFKDNQDFALLFEDAQKYFAENNVRYAEMFFAPTTFLKYGFEYNEIIDIFDEKIEQCRAQTGLDIKLIIDVSRTYGHENAEVNLELVEKYKTDNIIGIGLGGDEKMYPSDNFIKVFDNAKQAGLHIVAHAGEDLGAKSIWGALKLLKAERIGHGISSMEDSDLMNYLKQNRIPLEICPTSNIFTGKYVTKMKDHPIRLFYNKGIQTTVNSDDPIFFDTDISNEYYELYDKLNFTIDELVDISIKGLDASFHPHKDRLKAEFQKEIDRLRKEYQV